MARVGLGYDFWLDKLLARRRVQPQCSDDSPVVDASVGVPLLEVKGRNPFARDPHGHGLANPHYWLDPANAETITATMAIAIASRTPRGGRHRDRELQRFREVLRRQMEGWTHVWPRLVALRCSGYHDSWPYFARRFRFHFVGFVAPREGVTPSAAHLASLLTEARRWKVCAVFRTSTSPSSSRGRSRLGWVSLCRARPFCWQRARHGELSAIYAL